MRDKDREIDMYTYIYIYTRICIHTYGDSLGEQSYIPCTYSTTFDPKKAPLLAIPQGPRYSNVRCIEQSIVLMFGSFVSSILAGSISSVPRKPVHPDTSLMQVPSGA